MSRPAEISVQTGSDAEWEAFVRAEFPQCIKTDEDGNELVPVQYQKAYSADVGIEYFPRVLLDNSDPDPNNWVYSEKVLMIDWHREPESTEQVSRITARALLTAIIEDPDTSPENVLRAEAAREALRLTSYAGVEAINAPFNVWAGQPSIVDMSVEEALMGFARAF